MGVQWVGSRPAGIHRFHQYLRKKVIPLETTRNKIRLEDLPMIDPFQTLQPRQDLVSISMIEKDSTSPQSLPLSSHLVSSRRIFFATEKKRNRTPQTGSQASSPPKTMSLKEYRKKLLELIMDEDFITPLYEKFVNRKESIHFETEASNILNRINL
eukprot:906765_1